MQDKDKTAILVVDSDPHQGIAIKALLSKLNRTIILASSVREVLKQASTYDFSIILWDVQPYIDLFEAANFVRTSQVDCFTAIILLSDRPPEEVDISTIQASGIVDCVFKPIDLVLLREKVQNLSIYLSRLLPPLNIKKTLPH